MKNCFMSNIKIVNDFHQIVQCACFAILFNVCVLYESSRCSTNFLLLWLLLHKNSRYSQWTFFAFNFRKVQVVQDYLYLSRYDFTRGRILVWANFRNIIDHLLQIGNLKVLWYFFNKKILTQCRFLYIFVNPLPLITLCHNPR